MATEAARAALADAGVDAAEVDGIIVATATPDQAFPAAAVRVRGQRRRRRLEAEGEGALRREGRAVEREAEYRAVLLDQGQMPLRFEVFRRGEKLGEVSLPLPGRYNVGNAIGAIAVCDHLGVTGLSPCQHD
jgi:UDP-N-acetylmuramate-alanine ligase